MHQVEYDMPEAQSSLEFILEQAISPRQVIEMVRVTAVESPKNRGMIVMGGRTGDRRQVRL